MESKSALFVEKDHRSKANTTNIITAAGSSSAAAMILYFMITRAYGAHMTIELHFVNMLFILCAVVMSIYMHRKYEGRIKYLKGLAVGFVAAIVGSGLFSIFFAAYLGSDPQLLMNINNYLLMHEHLGPIAISILLFAEGVSSGAIMSFIAMQYFRTKA